MSNKNNDQLLKMRHSAEHILMMAVKKFYPKMKMAMGPATQEGFYFDVDLDNEKITEQDFKKIETEMHRLIKAKYNFKKLDLTIQEAKKLFKDNQYKQKWLDEIEERHEKATIYWTAKDTPDAFVDLCSGPHVENTSQIGPIKLLSIAGAYWHGDSKNKMLTRIYGTAFKTQEDLNNYLIFLEEVKKRDHRKIGQLQDLFSINEHIGQGLVLWHPKGMVIKETLENWGKQTEKDWGYQHVSTPNITKAGLYYTSGHLPYYQNDMYPPMKLEDGQEYYLKPMNCPHHHMIYASKPRSYKELPLRLAEYGTCYRYESSGELFGLMRVRGFTQNDAHIYCALDQAVDEFVQVMQLHEFYYRQLGIQEYHLELALRDPKNKKKYHGGEKMWSLAEQLMRQAVKRIKIPMVEEQGNAAFYGPKIDFIIHSSIGREFAISTNQIDLFMGDRFKLKYIDKDGSQQIPVIIHRAPLGSHERFIGFLIEHFGGAFPVWLAPIQAVIIPITDKNNQYALKIEKKLKNSNIRIEADLDRESMQNRIRKAEAIKIPYILIAGDREMENQTLSVRKRGRQDLGELIVEQVKTLIQTDIREKKVW